MKEVGVESEMFLREQANGGLEEAPIRHVAHSHYLAPQV
jgi:hypothetical protein